ncbi:hypothetical protein [Streptomyces sp. NPDC005009]
MPTQRIHDPQMTVLRKGLLDAGLEPGMDPFREFFIGRNPARPLSKRYGYSWCVLSAGDPREQGGYDVVRLRDASTIGTDRGSSSRTCVAPTGRPAACGCDRP